MRDRSEITLPVGRWSDGRRDRDAVVRPLDGADEELAAAVLVAAGPAAAIDELLARCVVELGGAEVDGDAIRALALGDREALALHVRALTFGPAMPCVVRCEACGEPMDIDLRADDLLARPGPDVPATLAETVAGVAVRFRLPTAGDVERAERADGEADALQVLCACVQVPERPDPKLLEAIGERMRTFDPQAETLLAFACPECGESASAALDCGAHLVREAALDAAPLIDDVHRLALAYGWSEAAILALPVPRRRRYVDLVDVVLTGEVLT